VAEEVTRAKMATHSSYEKNLSDKLIDWRSQSKRAIDGLTLLAKRLPNNEQKEIFYYDNIKGLLQAILHGSIEELQYYSKAKDKSIFKGQDTNYDNEFDNRIVQIAAFLVEEGTRICIEQYKTKHKLNDRLNQPIIDILDRAAGICDAIAFPFRVTKSQTLRYNIHAAEKNDKRKSNEK
jgi:hypothetical protein